jgi:hypothetical protein
MTILNLWPGDKNKKDLFYPRDGKEITRDILALKMGSCSFDLYSQSLSNLEACGIFRVEKRLGRPKRIYLGPMLDCSLVGCDDPHERHFPDWANPSEFRRGIPLNQRPLLQNSETSTPEFRDINNLNNLNEPRIRVSEVDQVEVYSNSESLAAEESKELSFEEYRQRLMDLTPPGLEIHENLIEFGFIRFGKGYSDEVYIIEWAKEGKTLNPDGSKWRAGIGNVFEEIVEITNFQNEISASQPQRPLTSDGRL